MMFKTFRQSSVVCIVAVIFCHLISAIAQDKSPSILRIAERNKDGSLRMLQKKPLIVDINSTLFIRVEKNTLRRLSAASGANTTLQDAIDTALLLQEAAQKGLEGLDSLLVALSVWPDSTGPDSTRLSNALRRVARPALRVLSKAPRGSALRNTLNKTLRMKSVADQYRVIFEAAAAEAERLKSKLDNALKSDGVYYQLGAWIVSHQKERPIHLPGFDEYPEGEAFKVENWNFTLSPDQQKQLEQLKVSAKEMDEKGLPNVVADLKNAAPKLILNRIKQSFSCILEVEDALDHLRFAGGESVQEIQNIIADVKKSVSDYRTFLIELRAKFKEDFKIVGESPSGFIASMQSDFADFKEKSTALINGISGLKDLPKKFQGDNKMAAAAKDLARSVTACEKQIKTKVTETFGKLQGVFAGLFSVKQIDASLLEFGDEVLKLDIENLPDSTEVNLINTGVRASGDALILKMAMGREGRKRRMLENHQIQLFHVEPHINTIVGMIYARPQSKNGIEGDYRIAPSYSVLFTMGSRGSIVYNRLFRPAIGLNVATMDFDHDNAPEIGFGLVLSIFQDYLQAGYGYNLQEKVGYGFFGLRLPVPTIGAASGN